MKALMREVCGALSARRQETCREYETSFVSENGSTAFLAALPERDILTE